MREDLLLTDSMQGKTKLIIGLIVGATIIFAISTQLDFNSETQLEEPIKPEPQPSPESVTAPPAVHPEPVPLETGPVPQETGSDPPHPEQPEIVGPGPSQRATAGPPGTDGRPSSSRTFEVIRSVHEQVDLLGPDAIDQGRDWLDSEDDLTRAAGALALAYSGALESETLARIAEDPEWSVPFLTLENLRGNGFSNEADQLEKVLLERRPELGQLLDAQAGQAFAFGGGEAAIDFARRHFDREEVQALAEAFSNDGTLPYEARMKALWELRKEIPVAEYRPLLESLRNTAPEEESAEWNQAMDRLRARWTGPDPVLDQPPVLHPDTLHQAFARDHERMLTDFYLFTDHTLTHPDGRVAQGTADLLTDYLIEFDQRPWNEEENLMRQRLVQMIEVLREQETEVSVEGPPVQP